LSPEIDVYFVRTQFQYRTVCLPPRKKFHAAILTVAENTKKSLKNVDTDTYPIPKPQTRGPI